MQLKLLPANHSMQALILQNCNACIVLCCCLHLLLGHLSPCLHHTPPAPQSIHDTQNCYSSPFCPCLTCPCCPSLPLLPLLLMQPTLEGLHLLYLLHLPFVLPLPHLHLLLGGQVAGHWVVNHCRHGRGGGGGHGRLAGGCRPGFRGRARRQRVRAGLRGKPGGSKTGTRTQNAWVNHISCL